MSDATTEPALRASGTRSSNVLARLGRAIADFWVKPIRAEPLAAMRILTALIIMAGALTGIAPNLSLYWFPDGVIPTDVAIEYGERVGRLSLLYWFDSPTAVVTLFIVWMLALAMIAVGLFTRVACIAAWVLAISFNMRALWVLNGGDDVAVQLLFYLMISPCGAAWSLDALRRRVKRYRDPASGFEPADSPRDHKPTLIRPWSVRLIQLQLIAIYLLNGINKINFDGRNDYLTGEALYWVLNDVTLARFAYDMFRIPLWMCRLMSWATLAFELGFPLFVLFRLTRKWILLVGVLFHLGVFFIMEINWFGQNTLCYYPVFLSAGALTAFVAWLARLGARGTFQVWYDTFCPVCRRSRLALELMDLGERLEFRDIHDREAMQRDVPGVPYQRALKEMIVVTPRGHVHGGFFAFRALSRGVPALWSLAVLMRIPGVPFVGQRIYRWIARNRYRLAKCDDGVCNLHLAALSQQHLDENEIARIVQQARAAAGLPTA